VPVAVAVRYDEGCGFTTIDDDVAPLVAALPATPVEICAVAQALVMLPNLAAAFGIPEARQDERSIRSVSDILRVLRQLDARAIEHPYESTPTELAVLDDFFGQFGPDQRGDAYGPERDAGGAASPLDRAIARSGRDPEWSPDH
jgi:hypothetical protein